MAYTLDTKVGEILKATRAVIVTSLFFISWVPGYPEPLVIHLQTLYSIRGVERSAIEDTLLDRQLHRTRSPNSHV